MIKGVIKKRVIKIAGFFLMIIFLAVIASALDSKINQTNLTALEEKAKACIPASEKIMDEILNAGFNIQRVNDTLSQGNNLLNAQLLLKQNKKNTDFSPIIAYCDEIASIMENAFKSRDEFVALLKFYNESLSSEMNTSEADKLVEEIKNEIKSERYELVFPLIDEAYSEITEIKSSQTAIKLFYDSTTQSLTKTIYNLKYYIIAFVILSIIFFIIYWKAIRKKIVQHKIEKLELRREVIRKLVMQTQKDYFDSGKMPEGIYHVRTKKFAELIRDVDRQIPLLKEELIKIKGVKAAKKAGGRNEKKKKERK